MRRRRQAATPTATPRGAQRRRRRRERRSWLREATHNYPSVGPAAHDGVARAEHRRSAPERSSPCESSARRRLGNDALSPARGPRVATSHVGRISYGRIRRGRRSDSAAVWTWAAGPAEGCQWSLALDAVRNGGVGGARDGRPTRSLRSLNGDPSRRTSKPPPRRKEPRRPLSLASSGRFAPGGSTSLRSARGSLTTVARAPPERRITAPIGRRSAVGEPGVTTRCWKRRGDTHGARAAIGGGGGGGVGLIESSSRIRGTSA